MKLLPKLPVLKPHREFLRSIHVYMQNHSKAKAAGGDKPPSKPAAKPAAAKPAAKPTGGKGGGGSAGGKKICKKDGDSAKGSEKWRKISLFGVVPFVAIMSMIVIASSGGHERPEFKKYSYLRKRDKRFAWGDGNKTLFHNPHVNPLPDGYEEEEDGE